MLTISPIKNVLVAIGRIQTTILMGALYYLVIGPMAVLYQMLKQEKHTGDSYWVKREEIADWERYLMRQF